jgi:hypothetical protein
MRFEIQFDDVERATEGDGFGARQPDPEAR